MARTKTSDFFGALRSIFCLGEGVGSGSKSDTRLTGSHRPHGLVIGSEPICILNPASPHDHHHQDECDCYSDPELRPQKRLFVADKKSNQQMMDERTVTPASPIILVYETTDSPYDHHHQDDSDSRAKQRKSGYAPTEFVTATATTSVPIELSVAQTELLTTSDSPATTAKPTTTESTHFPVRTDKFKERDPPVKSEKSSSRSSSSRKSGKQINYSSPFGNWVIVDKVALIETLPDSDSLIPRELTYDKHVRKFTSANGISIKKIIHVVPLTLPSIWDDAAKMVYPLLNVIVETITDTDGKRSVNSVMQFMISSDGLNNHKSTLR